MTHKFELKGKRSVQEKAAGGSIGGSPKNFSVQTSAKQETWTKIYKKNKKTRWLKLPTLSLLFRKSTRTK